MRRAAFLALLCATAATLLRPDPPPGRMSLGGLNGLAANYLWLYAAQQQEQGRYLELTQTADWLGALQPGTAGIHQLQAWNLIYNVAPEFAQPADQWRWVLAGLELLRDRAAVARGPAQRRLQRTLAQALLDNLGAGAAQPRYRRYWAELWPREPRAGWGLEPARMRALDREFGPFDWRTAAPHALYWATLGSTGEPPTANVARPLVHALQQAFAGGRLVLDPRGAGLLVLPNPAAAEAADEMFALAVQRYPQEAGFRLQQHVHWRQALLWCAAYGRLAEAAHWQQHLAAAGDGLGRVELGQAVAALTQEYGRTLAPTPLKAAGLLRAQAEQAAAWGAPADAAALRRLAGWLAAE